jgi:hypothetical protein
MLRKKTFILLSLTVIYILFYTKYIYIFFVNDTGNGFFVDWYYFVNAIKCEKTSESCGVFNYGQILLYLPFNKNLDFLYYKILPLFFIIIFVFLIFKIIKLNNKKDYFLILILLFNPSTLLLLERANFDLLIFITIIFICYSKSFWINYFLVGFSFLSKYYPISFFVNFFIENKLRTNLKSTILFSSCLILSFTFIFFHISEFKEFIENSGYSKAGYHYLFSIKAIAKVIKYLFDTNYIILLVFFYSLYIFISIKLFFYFQKKKLFNFFDLYKTEDKLFILGTNTLIVCFLFFSNWYYREVFLILSLPLLIRLKNETKLNIINFIINFIILRYLFLFLYSYLHLQETHYHIDGVRFFYNSFLLIVTIKGIADFLLMSFLSSFLIFYNIEILKKIKIY